MENPVARDSRQARSLLYVPGDQRDRLDKAFARGADALIVDLEDAVAPAKKAGARDTVAEWMTADIPDAGAVWLRINADSSADDIASIRVPIAGVMVPRAESGLLSEVAEMLDAQEDLLGINPDTMAIIPLIETARGLVNAVELAGMRRVVRLAIGRADLAGELGLSVDPEGPEFRTILLQLVIASSAARIAAPLAPTSTDFRDLDALRVSTEQLMKLGFRGRTAVHPAQVPVINDVFTPTSDEVQRAQRVVAQFEAAERSGSGVVVGEDGRMVDVAVVRAARDVLSRARTV